LKNQMIDLQTVMIGEVGLTGEVRSVMQLEPRIIEAERLGFDRCIVPYTAKKGNCLPKSRMELCFVKDLSQAFEIIFAS